MNDTRIIKRYQNRKLYDTHQSCYVTLEEIAHIMREGNEIQVIDNKTKNDITYITQIQLLFDQERKSTKTGNVELLKRVIRSSEGTLTGYIRTLETKIGDVVAVEEFKPFMQNSISTGVEATTLN
jgi:polyhydroxyalkanoate synthesis repressor PhaR